MKNFFSRFISKFVPAVQIIPDDLALLPLSSAEQITAVGYLRCKFGSATVDQLNIPADLKEKIALLCRTFPAGVTEYDLTYRDYILSFLTDPLCVKIKYAELSENNGCEFLRSGGEWVAVQFTKVTALLADACDGKIYFNRNTLYFSCFASDFPLPVEFNNRIWKSAEHYYQAQKFSQTPGLQGVPSVYEAVFNASTPDEARAIAEQNLSREDKKFWSRASRRFMFKAESLNYKFHPRSEIRQLLYATENLELINESSNLFWGARRDTGGGNLLGKALMQMRDSRGDCSILELLWKADECFEFESDYYD